MTQTYAWVALPGNTFLDTNQCPSCGSEALSVMRMSHGGPCTTVALKPVEVILVCGDCSRTWHSRASRWVQRA